MTAREFIDKEYPNHHFSKASCEQIAIQFARIKVKEALQAAASNAIVTSNIYKPRVYKQSILTAYPSRKIK